MQRYLFKSKIHRATVTDADLNYEGSITIDRELMDAANLMEYEQVSILNINNGERFETYVIEGIPGKREICLNGAAARKVALGDKIIIISYASVSDEELTSFTPTIVLVDSKNNISSISHKVIAGTKVSE
ncbi:MAG: aspartate 1-decarboxylase [Ignavibacteria bacterium GWF2_33_9]|nr:MAG: aspartate 1-decarboxylase [Ignavibacteria bacterium GWF2_33_9]